MQPIERKIIVTLVTNLSAAGFKPCAIYTGEGYVMAPSLTGLPVELTSGPFPDMIRELSIADVLRELDAYDADCTLHFTNQHKATWGNRGVMLVLGNGCDVVSDYHCADPEPSFADIIGRVLDNFEGAHS